MPFDGISYIDSGHKIVPPAEKNIQAEMYSQVEAKTFIKKLDESHKIQQDGKNKKKQDNQKSSKEKNDSNEEFYDDNSAELSNKSTKIKKYKVSFNQSSDMVELIDKETGNIIETISPNDLLGLVSKSKTISGILVDRRI